MQVDVPGGQIENAARHQNRRVVDEDIDAAIGVERLLHYGVDLFLITDIGLYRDPETLTAVEYYMKLPEGIEDRQVVAVDPMLATGNSAIAAVQRIKQRGADSIKLACLLAAPEGIASFHAALPDVPIYTAAIDSHLNEHGYIVPGLGDAGDRMYGTK